MKSTLLTHLLLIVFFSLGYAQEHRQESVEWTNPKVYKAKSFLFETDSIRYESKNCKILEIKTISGVTGYYVAGEGTIKIDSKGISDKSGSSLFRFNPTEVANYIKTENMKEVTDDGFVSSSMAVLKSSFKHCYHSNMDALIPESGDYGINFFSVKLGEVLVSYYNKEFLYYNFKIRSKM